MPTNNRKQNLADVVPDSNVSGEGLQPTKSEGGSSASPEELALALEASQERIAALEAQLAAAKQSGDNSVSELAKALAALVPKSQAQVPASDPANNINRTTDFAAAKTTVDGRSLVEAQQTLRVFREEEKRPISIPKSIANFVGSSLDITVNGVRVSIPCDGRTYMINETHWLHARERLAKLDLLNDNTTPQIVTLGDD